MRLVSVPLQLPVPTPAHSPPCLPTPTHRYDDGNKGCKDAARGEKLQLAAEKWTLLEEPQQPTAGGWPPPGTLPGSSSGEMAPMLGRRTDGSQGAAGAGVGDHEQRQSQQDKARGKRPVDEERAAAAGGASAAAGAAAAGGRDPVTALRGLLPFLPMAQREEAERQLEAMLQRDAAASAGVAELVCRERDLVAQALGPAAGQAAGASRPAAALPAGGEAVRRSKLLREEEERAARQAEEVVGELQREVGQLRRRLAGLVDLADVVQGWDTARGQGNPHDWACTRRRAWHLCQRRHFLSLFFCILGFAIHEGRHYSNRGSNVFIQCSHSF